MSALNVECGQKGINVDRILIAGLGNRDYDETIYVYDGFKSIEKKTKYVFDAVGEVEHPNKLMLVGTLDSKWENLIDYYNEHTKKKISPERLNSFKEFLLKQRSIKKHTEAAPITEATVTEQCIADEDNRENEGTITEIDTQCAKLFRKIEEFLEQEGGFSQVKIVIIPAGIDKNQQDEYFDSLRTGMDALISKDKNKRTEIIFDITYAFRSIPIYVMMLVRYFDFLKSQNIEFRAYYGAFEAKNREKNTTPLIDLSIVPIMTDWINAIHDFIEFGSVKTLIKCLEKEKEGKSAEEAAYLEEVTREFSTFEYAMNANNLYYLVRGIVYITGLKYVSVENEDIRVLDVNHSAFSRQAQMMLETIREEYCNRFSTQTMQEPGWSTTESYVLAQIARLYTAQGNYGDAAIAFQESVLTYVMERFLKESIMATECFSANEQFYMYTHDFSNREKKKQNYIDYLNARLHDKNLKEFDKLYIQIKDKIRNTQAHFKYEKTATVTIPEMEEWLRTATKMLLEEMESGYKTEFVNCTGLISVYPRKSREDFLYEAQEKFFRMLLKRVKKNEYDLADNLDAIIEDQEMKKILKILKLSDEAVLQWVNELKTYCQNSGEPSVLVETTYCKWVDNKVARAKAKSKDLTDLTLINVDTSLTAYLTSLPQVPKNRATVVNSIAAISNIKI